MRKWKVSTSLRDFPQWFSIKFLSKELPSQHTKVAKLNLNHFCIKCAERKDSVLVDNSFTFKNHENDQKFTSDLKLGVIVTTTFY